MRSVADFHLPEQHKLVMWLVVGLSLLAGLVRALGTELPRHVHANVPALVLESPSDARTSDPVEPACLIEFPAALAVADATST